MSSDPGPSEGTELNKPESKQDNRTSDGVAVEGEEEEEKEGSNGEQSESLREDDSFLINEYNRSEDDLSPRNKISPPKRYGTMYIVYVRQNTHS